MKRTILVAVGLAMLSLPVQAATPPTTQAEAEAALAAAQKVEATAVALEDAWVPTEADLKTAEKAIAAQDWDAAKVAADKALVLANLSVEQANEQKSVWRLSVFH
jgi:hypothetical protein